MKRKKPSNKDSAESPGVNANPGKNEARGKVLEFSLSRETELQFKFLAAQEGVSENDIICALIRKDVAPGTEMDLSAQKKDGPRLAVERGSYSTANVMDALVKVLPADLNERLVALFEMLELLPAGHARRHPISKALKALERYLLAMRELEELGRHDLFRLPNGDWQLCWDKRRSS